MTRSMKMLHGRMMRLLLKASEPPKEDIGLVLGVGLPWRTLLSNLSRWVHICRSNPGFAFPLNLARHDLTGHGRVWRTDQPQEGLRLSAVT